MAPRLFGKKRRSQGDRETDGVDWAEFVRQGASVTLALVKEAAEFAPVPGLKQAAGSTLQILTIIQAVKDNKSAFRLLGDEATALIAVIWRSHQTSLSKETWPPEEFKPVLEDLVTTLASITEYVRNKLERPIAVRWVYSMADSANIDEYREKLRHAVHKFEIASQLTIVDATQQLLNGQRQILEQLAAKGIVVERTETEKILERLKALDIDDHNPSRPDSPFVHRDITAMQQNESAPRSVHVEATVSSQDLPKDPVDVDAILAAAKRYEAEERKFLESKSSGKIKDHGTSSNLYRQATVETDEEMDDAETAVEENWQSSSDSEDSSKLDKLKERKPRPKAAKKKSHRDRPKSIKEATGNLRTSTEGMHTSMRNTKASVGNTNTSMGNMSTSGNIYFQGQLQNPPMFRSPPPNPQFVYPPHNPFFSPLPVFPQYGPSPQSYTSFPGSPPIDPTAGSPNSGFLIPPNMFGYGPNISVKNNNSGNIHKIDINDVGNDNRVITYNGAPPRKKNRRR